jgi:serine/threonine protein kinase
MLPVQAGGIEGIDYESEKPSLIGTPLYMSPEQAAMQRTDHRTDLYSAGLVFYKMLSGEELFKIKKGCSEDGIKELINDSQPLPMKKFRNDVPPQIDEIISKFLRKNPEDRYSGAGEAIGDLMKLMSEFQKNNDSRTLRIPTAAILNSPAAILKDTIYLLLLDGMITRQEREELDKRAEKLGMSDIESMAIEEKLRQEMDLPCLKDVLAFKNAVEQDKAIEELEKYREKFCIAKKEASSIIGEVKRKE